ncbi:hypothetical protein [Snuella sedimenti]|uniref:Uncharacterized protein n=1 Tax=Snuella sedimenti TaxID=2798802 RepID=A0A8J7JEA6_9FLAO|nr:hypothetical protein [Snuella sedimenti]MBJ6369754.1 hypothetical protein [Snuella sedimenti]
MNKFLLSFMLLFILACNTGNLTIISDLPSTLNEASGIDTTVHSDLIWMLNDSGNPPVLFGTDHNGNIVKKLKLNAKNKDWEDLTSDTKGNLYIGDFGNNTNKRKDLAILIVRADSLKNAKETGVERISFRYPDQKKFPPKKHNFFYDCEAFFHFNDSLYLFTKSHVKGNGGHTNLYKVPAMKGHYTAELIGSFNAGADSDSKITSADIDMHGKQIVLLTHTSVWLFNNFKGTDFLGGTATQLPFYHNSQKESVCFKDPNTLYITDEKTHGSAGYLYEFKLR